MLRSHYRSPIDVTDDTLRDAEAALARLDAFARRVAGAGLPPADPDADALARFRAVMDDDLQTPEATGLLFDLVRRANVALDAGDAEAAAPLAAAATDIAGALGLELRGDPAGDGARRGPGVGGRARRGPGGEGLGSGRRAPRPHHRRRLRRRGHGRRRGGPPGLTRSAGGVERDYVRRTGRPA